MRFMTYVRTAAAIVGPPRPIILYHKPTARCDCRCRFCDSWINQPEHDDSPPSSRIIPLIARAHRAGMTMYTLWGGEPLTVPQISEWLDRAHELGMMTTVCTSGFRLSERAAELGPHVDQLLISLEALGSRQDKIRGTPGLFERVVSGIAEWRKHSRGEIILWSNVSRETRDQVDGIAAFARDNRIGVEFFPAATYPGYNESLILDSAERNEVFTRVKSLKREGFPVLNSEYALELMRTGRPFKCNLARLAIQVAPDGTAYPCEPRVIPGLEPYGDIDRLDLAALPKSASYRQAAQTLSACNACLLPCVANMADSIPGQAVRRFINRVKLPG